MMMMMTETSVDLFTIGGRSIGGRSSASRSILRVRQGHCDGHQHQLLVSIFQLAYQLPIMKFNWYIWLTYQNDSTRHCCSF